MEKRIFDKEALRRLSGLLPFSPGSFAVWTPDEFLDSPVELQPILHIRPFSTEIKELIRSSFGSKKFGLETMREAIQSACIFWDNLVDMGTMTLIPFSVDAFADLPESLVTIIYHRISEITFGITKVEKEVLGSLQPSTSAPSSKVAESAEATQA